MKIVKDLNFAEFRSELFHTLDNIPVFNESAAVPATAGACCAPSAKPQTAVAACCVPRSSTSKSCC